MSGARGDRLVGAVVAMAGVLLTLAVGTLFILLAGASPERVYARLVREVLLSPYGIGQTLFKATPLIFTGLAVAVPLRAGLFNIGAEGQLYVGAFAAAWVALLAAAWPGALLFAITVLAAFAGGALWGGVAGVLKARLGAHEVITTIMLNFLAVAFTGYAVTYHLAVPETVRTAEVPASVWLPRLSDFVPALRGSPANLAFVIALLVCGVVAVFLWRTKRGYEIRAVGVGARAAEAGGISPRRTQVLAMTLGGGLAGLVGLNQVLGYRHYFEANFSEGLGFMGIAVALLGRSHPVGIVLAALLFGAMSHGGFVVNNLVPKEIVGILQATVILMILAGRYVTGRLLVARRKRRLAVGV